MGRLDGQVGIVTGGANGIGGATARKLASEGARILIADINMEAAEANAKRIADAGGTAKTLRANVADHDDIKAMVEHAVATWGRLDILVNNAYSPDPDGDPAHGSAVTVSERAWDHGMNVLVKSMFLGAKYAVPEMAKNNHGSIINISSVHGLLMAPNRLIYEAGKSAVIGVTRQMAIDFGPMGVRVNAICPGHIVTERMSTRWADNPGGLRFFEQHYPVRRTGVPMDIANAICFLCSDEASFITGHPLVVDGGMTIQLQEDVTVHTARWIQEHPDTKLPY
jgi:NAD(P)-dependent dehydrogenase (short-subunit alcohol dehydrogenase family)